MACNTLKKCSCPQKNDQSPQEVRNSDGTVRLRNPHIELMSEDILYHIGLDTGSQDLVEMFGDVKFVCMGGVPQRMESFAHYIMKEIGHKLPAGTQLMDISKFAHRYSMFKVGPVISVSHGMGAPSIGILLHELIKLMYHAKCKDPVFFRTGTSGGVGIAGGTVVVSDNAVDGMLNNYYQVPILGKLVQRPVILNKCLANELKALGDEGDAYKTVMGTTLGTDDFYEGQGRIDGAFCDYTEADKMKYLESLRDKGVKNIEMEVIPFSALTNHAGIKAAHVCVAILNRLEGDQISTPMEVLEEWQSRPQELVARYIKKHLQQTK